MGAPQYEQAGADIGGTGTANTIPRWTGASTLGDSGLIDDGSQIYTTSRVLAVNTATTLGTGLIRFQVGSASALANYQGAQAGFMLPAGSGSWFELCENSTNGTTFRISKDASTGVVLNANGKNIGFSASGYTTAVASSQMVLLTSGNVGIGTASPAARLHATFADSTVGTLFSGATKAVRFVATSTQMSIDGIDNTGLAGFQQLQINGLPLLLATSGTERARIDSAGNLLMAGNGTAANPIIANSTGVSGMYFPSATTVAIAANGAIAATFSKVAGAGVTLGGTTGLVFDASGSQQGIKLRATPDSTDTQTLDCYQENTWTPTLSAAATWGGTAPTITSARYTRVGRTVTCSVILAATGGAAYSSTWGSTTISAPFASGEYSVVPCAREAPGGLNGIQQSSTVYLPTTVISTAAYWITWTYQV